MINHLRFNAVNIHEGEGLNNEIRTGDGKSIRKTHLCWVVADMGDRAGYPEALGLPLSTYSETTTVSINKDVKQDLDKLQSNFNPSNN